MDLTQDIYDIIVIGLGAMGSASFYHAAKTGRKVLGLEQFEMSHSKGSYHGETRIIREAYFEGEFYVPMAQEAARLWRDLEKECGMTLYEKIGCLMVGKPTSKNIVEAKLSADKHNLPYKMYDEKTIKSRVPGWNLPEGFVALFDESAGFLHPERCIAQHVTMAQKRNSNAKSLYQTKVSSYKKLPNSELMEVKTDKGIFLCKQLIISAGFCANDFLKDLSVPLLIQKNSVVWFNNHEE